MCQFFSFVSDGNGKFMYFDHNTRTQIVAGQLANYDSTDSHTSIADYYGYKGKKEDTLNKYEYNPLTREFKIDRTSTVDDSSRAKKWVQTLDFSTIVPELTLKDIVNPLKIMRTLPGVSSEEIKWLHQWESVGESVGESVWGVSLGLHSIIF